MKNVKLVFIALVSLVMIATSCSTDDDDVVIPDETGTVKSGEVTLSRKTNYGNDWIYYSFTEEKEVEVTDHETSLAWDIAFNRYNVRTNGGESGSGQGGAYDAGEVDFASITMAAESGYIVDDTIQIVEAFTGQGVDWMTSTGNDEFKGCIEMVSGNMGPTYNANNHIYVIMTADGKYAKLWIKSYYSETGESGFISFEYAYQSADGRELE